MSTPALERRREVTLAVVRLDGTSGERATLVVRSDRGDERRRPDLACRQRG